MHLRGCEKKNGFSWEKQHNQSPLDRSDWIKVFKIYLFLVLWKRTNVEYWADRANLIALDTIPYTLNNVHKSFYLTLSYHLPFHWNHNLFVFALLSPSRGECILLLLSDEVDCFVW